MIYINNVARGHSILTIHVESYSPSNAKAEPVLYCLVVEIIIIVIIRYYALVNFN